MMRRNKVRKMWRRRERLAFGSPSSSFLFSTLWWGVMKRELGENKMTEVEGKMDERYESYRAKMDKG